MSSHGDLHSDTRSAKDFVVIAAKGALMGAADVVPGVSGGTIALITGIYQELLSSLKGLTPLALKTWYHQGFKAFWREINGSFLLALLCGIAFSLKTFASVISWAMLEHPLLVWGLFSGLILASIFVLFKGSEGTEGSEGSEGSQGAQGSQAKVVSRMRWRWPQVIGFILGVCFVVAIALAKPTQAPDTWWMVFLGGFIAICAMILPGISGSFILLLIGLYPVFINALNSFNLVLLASFGAGCVCGLLVFSHFLSWLLDRYYSTTLAVMMGFLLGSVYVTWPWKHVISSVVDRHGELVPLVQRNVSPFAYEHLSGASPHVLGVCIAAISGVLLVLLTDYVSKKV